MNTLFQKLQKLSEIKHKCLVDYKGSVKTQGHLEICQAYVKSNTLK